jgi:hypothetical protein
MHKLQNNSFEALPDNYIDIPAYEAFRQVTTEATKQDSSASEFKRMLKNNPHMFSLLSSARQEFQQIYNAIAKDLALPSIPVYVTTRMKVSTRGMAFLNCESPKEIRVYPIQGISGVSRSEWRTRDITLCSKTTAFEILKHEIAHVIAIHRNGETGDHCSLFVEAYDEANRYFKANGYADLIDSELELWGCPPYSHAAAIAASRKAKINRDAVRASQGCFTMAVFSTLISVSLFTFL